MLEYPKEKSITCKENQCYLSFEKRIDDFVKNYLSGYFPIKANKNKVIHDPVWGTTLFYKWELQILDSPLLQRLRDISQLGLTMLTYPTAHHTRFEHTLGVMSVITKMVNNINQSDDSSKIVEYDLYELRLAALLHDIGHCFFSHLSESIYGKLKDFVELKKSFYIFKTAKEHEIFAYIIINSPTFKSFIKKNVELWTNGIDLDALFMRIGFMIVGATLPYVEVSGGGYERKNYMTQMINGQYDADKLDYLRRDSYTAGLALTYDIDRFLYKIKIVNRDENIAEKRVTAKHLVIPISGVSAVEEMAFSQLMLASYIYQHQKVLATDAIIHDIVEGLMINGKLEHPCDFLYYCDSDILGLFSKNPDEEFKFSMSQKSFDAVSDKKISDVVKGLRNRELPKRAFIVNYAVVTDLNHDKQYKVSDIADRLKKINYLRDEIYNLSVEISNKLPKEIGGRKHIDFYDIYISIPKTSIAKDLSNALVLTNNKKFVNLSEIVRLSDWADAFAWHKWNAYVFAKADILPIVSIASKIAFERHGLRFDEEKVFTALSNEREVKKLVTWLKENDAYPNIGKSATK